MKIVLCIAAFTGLWLLSGDAHAAKLLTGGCIVEKAPAACAPATATTTVVVKARRTPVANAGKAVAKIVKAILPPYPRRHAADNRHPSACAPAACAPAACTPALPAPPVRGCK